jgi:hypothetical protein
VSSGEGTVVAIALSRKSPTATRIHVFAPAKR